MIGCAFAALSEAGFEETMTSIHVLRGAIAAGMVIATSAAAGADQWPSRPIRTISPFPAGSASDTTGRVVLDQISQLLGQPFVVENRAGAGGILGFAEVAKAQS
jgi:tripartite-type tricarboxylate transporter receptor subunit TctC